MKVKVSEKGVLIPRKFLKGVKEVEVRQQNGLIIIVPVGAKDPITTRFMDKQERAFIIDVQKAGNQSVLFLTLETELGRMTVEAGRAIRATRREEGFFFDLLSRLESTLPKTQPR